MEKGCEELESGVGTEGACVGVGSCEMWKGHGKGWKVMCWGSASHSDSSFSD